MLDLLFKNYSPTVLGENKISIRVTANYSLIVYSKGKGWVIEFGSTRTDKGNLNGTKIGQFTTINKTREILNRCIASKKDAITLAMRYVDPLQLVGKVIDPFGNKMQGVNALKTSEIYEYQKQGYAFVSSAKGEMQPLKVKRRILEFIK